MKGCGSIIHLVNETELLQTLQASVNCDTLPTTIIITISERSEGFNAPLISGSSFFQTIDCTGTDYKVTNNEAKHHIHSKHKTNTNKAFIHIRLRPDVSTPLVV